MNILSGKYKSRRLVVPDQQTTRPTLTRVRQVLFDILQHGHLLAGWDGLQVADVYAGSGSLGLEALSRGAEKCVFFERDAQACMALKTNIQHLQVVKDTRILPDAETPVKAVQPCDLLLCDPPYAEAVRLDEVLQNFVVSGWIAPATLVVVQSGKNAKYLQGFAHLRSKKVGITRLSFYRGNADATPSGRAPIG